MLRTITPTKATAPSPRITPHASMARPAFADMLASATSLSQRLSDLKKWRTIAAMAMAMIPKIQFTFRAFFSGNAP
jgi:hypothetical protein